MALAAKRLECYGQPVLYGLLLILVGILCSRLLLSAFTSGDDGYTAFAAVAPQGLLESAKEMAIFQGRFYQLAVYPLAMLPFTTESIVLVNMSKIFTFLMFLYGMWYLCWVMLGRNGALACIAIFLCLFDTVGGSYNPFHGLPLWFGLGCGLLFLSLGWHIKAVKNGESSAWAYALFGVSLLTYEIVLFYAPLFPLITLCFSSKSCCWWDSATLAEVIRRSIPVFFYVALYLLLYLIFRHYYPGTYTGATGLTIAPLKEVLRPILSFSLHAFYWNRTIIGSDQFSFASVAYAVIGLVSVALALWHVYREGVSSSAEAEIDRSLALFLVAVLVLYVFAPNLLFGFTERYRIWAGDGVKFYLGSLFSAVPLTVLLYLGFRKAVQIARGSTVGRASIGVAALVFFAVTYANAKSAENFYRQNASMAIRWSIADWASADLANKWPTSFVGPVVVCGDGFTHSTELPVYSRNPDFIADAEIYWSRYLSRKSQRYVQFVNRPAAGADCHARLRLSYRQGLASFDRFDQSIKFWFSPATCVTNGTYERPAGVTWSCQR